MFAIKSWSIKNNNKKKTRRHNRWRHCDCQPLTSSIVASSCIKVSKQHHYRWVQRPKRSFILCEKCLPLVIHPGWRNVYYWYIATDSPHANTVQRRKQTYILQMWWIELKYAFYLQNPAYFPRIHLWIFDKYSSTSFWWLSVYQQNFTAKSIKYYNPPAPPPRDNNRIIK